MNIDLTLFINNYQDLLPFIFLFLSFIKSKFYGQTISGNDKYLRSSIQYPKSNIQYPISNFFSNFAC